MAGRVGFMSRQYTLQRALGSSGSHVDYAGELNEQQLAAFLVSAADHGAD
jgi:hypothetical protein